MGDQRQKKTRPSHYCCAQHPKNLPAQTETQRAFVLQANRHTTQLRSSPYKPVHSHRSQQPIRRAEALGAAFLSFLPSPVLHPFQVVVLECVGPGSPRRRRPSSPDQLAELLGHGAALERPQHRLSRLDDLVGVDEVLLEALHVLPAVRQLGALRDPLFLDALEPAAASWWGGKDGGGERFVCFVVVPKCVVFYFILFYNSSRKLARVARAAVDMAGTTFLPIARSSTARADA